MNPRFHDGTGYEQHSADGQCFVQRAGDGWGVWWKGWRWHPEGSKEPATYETREEARKCIRALRSNEPTVLRGPAT